MNELVRQLAERIQKSGTISFAEFMRFALYDPADGYYCGALNQIGGSGDFFTSVSVGPLFGELLAFQFAHWIRALPRNRDAIPAGTVFQLVEAGAHDGQLAFDILRALKTNAPELLAVLQYWIIEPFQRRRAAQQTRLSRFTNVRWFDSLSEIQAQVNGILFSNELLDAMPVHVFRWNAAEPSWQEMGVAFHDNRFVWDVLVSASASPPTLPKELLDVLPDGYTVELSSDAVQWWRDAAGALASGKLMTIDYGGTLEELLSPGRTSGTLRAYSRHRVGADVLRRPGEQDITAHVNFSEIRRVGETLGLKTETFTTQSQFLSALAREMWMRTGSWPQHQVRQFQTLTHPEHLGRPFRVLVQSR